jgi:hypothetical protein
MMMEMGEEIMSVDAGYVWSAQGINEKRWRRLKRRNGSWGGEGGILYHGERRLKASLNEHSGIQTVVEEILSGYESKDYCSLPP